MACEPVLVFRDNKGKFHETSEACCWTNKEIRNDEDIEERLNIVYTEFEEYFNVWHMQNRGVVQAEEDFIKYFVRRGYDLIRVRDYE